MRFPDQGLTFDPPLRVFNMSGGVSCLVGNSGLCWLMPPNIYSVFWSELGVRTHQIARIETLRKMSFSFYRTAEELERNTFESVCIDLANEDGSLLDESQIHRWMGLAVAYRNMSQPLRAMRAERISKQIRFCRSAINRLFKSYRTCLSEKSIVSNISDIEQGSFKFFSDPYAQDIAYCLQPCLDALFSLRDFVVTFLFEEMYERKTKLAHIIDVLSEDDKYGLKDFFVAAFCQREPYGIVARMASYRNAFFHYLGSSGGPLSEAYCLTHVDSVLGQIPRVSYPLDDNFERVRSIERGAFAGYGDKEEHRREAQRFMSSGRYVDALDLCFDCLCELLKIVRHMESHIPIESQNLRLTDKDILEAGIVKNGVRRKFKRNADGQLTEIDDEEQ